MFFQRQIFSGSLKEIIKAPVFSGARSYSSFKSCFEGKVEKRPKEACVDPNDKKPKRSLWKKMYEEKPVKIPPKHTCKKILANYCVEDPDFSGFDGQPYRTAGPAYIIQKDTIPPFDVSTTKEEKILKEIEADSRIKDNVNIDPISSSLSVEEKLIEMSNRKLHPAYNFLKTIPRKNPLELVPPKQVYKTRSGPYSMDDIPKRLKFNTDLAKRKVLFADLKEVQPPQQLVAPIVELKQNLKPELKLNVRKELTEKKN